MLETWNSEGICFTRFLWVLSEKGAKTDYPAFLIDLRVWKEIHIEYVIPHRKPKVNNSVFESSIVGVLVIMDTWLFFGKCNDIFKLSWSDPDYINVEHLIPLTSFHLQLQQTENYVTLPFGVTKTVMQRKRHGNAT